jgi:hypothetical protein
MPCPENRKTILFRLGLDSGDCSHHGNKRRQDVRTNIPQGCAWRLTPCRIEIRTLGRHHGRMDTNIRLRPNVVLFQSDRRSDFRYETPQKEDLMPSLVASLSRFRRSHEFWLLIVILVICVNLGVAKRPVRDGAKSF